MRINYNNLSCLDKKRMASILQHQVESKVNDLYYKMQRHAQIIMKLSVELDRVSRENEELRDIVNQDRRIIKKLYEVQKQSDRNRGGERENVEMDINNNDIRTSNETSIMNEYNNYREHDNNESNNESK